MVFTPPGIAARLNDCFKPRKMELKGWVADYRRCSLEELTNNKDTNFISDLQKMVPNEFRKHKVGTRPRQKNGFGLQRRSSMCGSRMRLNMATLIGMLVIVKNELNPANCMANWSRQDWK